MSRQGRAGLTLIFTGIFIASNLYIMIPLQTMLTELYDVSLNIVSLASFMFIFPYAIGLFFCGLIADKIEHRKILIFGMFGLTGVTFSLSIVQSFELMVTLRALQGFLAASFAPTAFSYSFEHYSGRHQSFIIAMINTGFLFAGIFGQVLSAFFAFQFSFSFVFIGFGFIYFICCLLMLFTLDNSHVKSYKKLLTLAPIVTFIRKKTLRKLYGISFFLLLTVMVFYGTFELYIQNNWRGFPFSLQTFRFIGLVGIIPAFFAGKLEEKLGAVNTLLLSLFIMIFAFMFQLISINIPTVILTSILLIASTALSIPMVILLIGIEGRQAKAFAVAIYSFTLLTGASIGSALVPIISFKMVPIYTILIFCLLSIMTLSLRKEIEQKKKAVT